MTNINGASAWAAMQNIMDGETMFKLMMMLSVEGAEKTYERCGFDARMPKDICEIIKAGLRWKDAQMHI